MNVEPATPRFASDGAYHTPLGLAATWLRERDMDLNPASPLVPIGAQRTGVTVRHRSAIWRLCSWPIRPYAGRPRHFADARFQRQPRHDRPTWRGDHDRITFNVRRAPSLKPMWRRLQRFERLPYVSVASLERCGARGDRDAHAAADRQDVLA